MNNIPDSIDSKFRFVLIAANRAEQLMRGARPKIEVAANDKLTTVASTEVRRDLVEWQNGPAPVVEVPEEESALDESLVADAAGDEG